MAMPWTLALFATQDSIMAKAGMMSWTLIASRALAYQLGFSQGDHFQQPYRRILAHRSAHEWVGYRVERQSLYMKPGSNVSAA